MWHWGGQDRLVPALIWMVAAFAGVGAAASHQSGEEPRVMVPLPNLVLIVADDLGWGDLGTQGARWIRTPNLDALATRGVRFTQAYSAAPVCSPSRAALLTGRYPIRTGITRVLKPHSLTGIGSQELTLAELLRQAGYATAIVGKWHLGDRHPYLPLQHGFDEFFGMPYSNDMKPLLFMEGNRVRKGDIPADPLLTRRYTERAVDFIRQHADRPFFLFLSHSMPHYPIDATASWKGSSRDGVYGDVVQELDWSVGEVVRALEETGLEGRTAVFFTSDNGSWRRRSNSGLRGKKGSTWEGGMRVPLLACFPGLFPAGRVMTDPVMGFDLFPTLLALAQREPPGDRPIDGIDLLPWLRQGSSEAPGVRERALFYYRDETVQAVRVGAWKLHVARHGWWDRTRPIAPELYDLESDPGESRDLAAEYPQRVRALEKRIEAWEASATQRQF